MQSCIPISNLIKRSNAICILLSFLLIFCTLSARGQNVKIHEDPAISRMMERFSETNKNKKVVSGWRIQIASTTDRRVVDEVMSAFAQQYPDVLLSWVHAKPYYQVRAGAFRTKLESMRLLRLIKIDFPDAYPVMDNNIRQAEIAGVKK